MTRILGLALLDGAGDAADEAAAADGDDDGFEVRNLVEEFEADGSLPGDHFVVVEGMQEGEAVGVALADGFGAGFVVVGAVEDDFRAVAGGGGDLDQRRHQRHDDARADAVLAGVEGDGLGVIAGAGGDDAAAALVVGEGEDLVERAALFEGAGALQVVELEEDLLAGHLGKPGGVARGREVDVAADALLRGADGVEGDGQAFPPCDGLRTAPILYRVRTQCAFLCAPQRVPRSGRSHDLG